MRRHFGEPDAPAVAAPGAQPESARTRLYAAFGSYAGTTPAIELRPAIVEPGVECTLGRMFPALPWNGKLNPSGCTADPTSTPSSP